MGRLIVLLLLIAGCFYLYQNQEQIMQNVENFFRKEKTVTKLNQTDAIKQKALEDAQREVLGY